MHLCDTCKKFNTCYPKGSWPTKEKRREVEKKGCKSYKELTVESMFLGNKKKEVQ